MRQVIINTPITNSENIEQIAGSYHANLMHKTKEDAHVVLNYTIENRHLGNFLHKIQHLENIKVYFSINPVIQLQTPLTNGRLAINDVSEKSSMEVYLSVWQSLGAYKSFLTYSFIAAIVTWIALYTNTIYLLIGGMLVAPFAVAALSTAMGSAAGDTGLMKKGMIRYILVVGTGFLTSVLLSILLPVTTYSTLMVQTSQVSSLTMLLPIASGIAGAVGLINSERNNLIPEAAYGLLISANLAPQSVLAGIAVMIGETEGILNVLFILLLQLVFIHLSASMVFRFYSKISASKVGIPSGLGKIFVMSTAITGVAAVILIAWQFSSTPDLQKSNIESEITSIIKSTTDSIPQIDLVEANVKFTQSKEKEINPVLCEIYIIKLEQYFNPNDFTEYTNLLIRSRLKESIKEKIRQRNLKVHPIFKIEFVSS